MTESDIVFTCLAVWVVGAFLATVAGHRYDPGYADAGGALMVGLAWPILLLGAVAMAPFVALNYVARAVARIGRRTPDAPNEDDPTMGADVYAEYRAALAEALGRHHAQDARMHAVIAQVRADLDTYEADEQVPAEPDPHDAPASGPFVRHDPVTNEPLADWHGATVNGYYHRPDDAPETNEPTMTPTSWAVRRPDGGITYLSTDGRTVHSLPAPQREDRP
jgi:hypothetical protein